MRNHVKITLVCVISAVALFSAFGANNQTESEDQQVQSIQDRIKADRVITDHKLRSAELEHRKRLRQISRDFITQAYQNSDYELANIFREEQKQQEDDWKEEDFRKELISAVRQ